MKRITKKALDELATTMSVIPVLEQMSYVGASDPYNFSTKSELSSFLQSHVSTSNSSYVEATFYFFADGSYGANVDKDHSTATTSNIILQAKSDGWYYDGKKVVATGHTHKESSEPSDEEGAHYEGVEDYIYFEDGYYFYDTNMTTISLP